MYGRPVPEDVVMVPKSSAPHAIGEVFDLDIDELEIDLQANLRDADKEGLRTLAESMRPRGGIGQLHPISVEWTGTRYAVAAGFRRAMAMKLFRDEMGFRSIMARRLESSSVALVRLVENLERENPTSFETCKYVYELATGTGGRTEVPKEEIAAAIGRSSSYVRNMVRFFRGLPADLKALWKEDRDRRFTFHVLVELTRLAQAGDEPALWKRVAEILGKPDLAPKTTEFFSRINVAPAEPDESPSAATARPLPRKDIRKLFARIDAIGEDRLEEDDRAAALHAVLKAIVGAQPFANAMKVIEEIGDVGVRES
jgi:ParB/RepB/Spo0J family partition protein